MVVCYIVMVILGIIVIRFSIKNSKLLVVAGALLAAAGLFLLVCTVILAWAVSHSEPNPKFEDNTEFDYGEVYETTDGDVLNEIGIIVAEDDISWYHYTDNKRKEAKAEDSSPGFNRRMI